MPTDRVTDQQKIKGFARRDPVYSDGRINHGLPANYCRLSDGSVVTRWGEGDAICGFGLEIDGAPDAD